MNTIPPPAPPAAPSSPAPAPSTAPVPSSASVPTKRGSKRLIGAVVVVVVVVIVVLALVATGAIPLGTSSGGGTTSTPLSSSDALSAANSLANGTNGGPWYLSEVAGLDLTIPYTNDTQPIVPTGCTVSQWSGISVPSYTGNYSDGKLTTWLFVYVNAAGTSELLLTVQNGQARIAELISGMGCGVGNAARLPAAFVNATDAADAALGSRNISDFVRNYSSANAEYLLLPPGDLALVSGFDWFIIYTSCDLQDPSDGPAMGSFAYGEVNATTGTLVASAYAAPLNCTTSISPPSGGSGGGSTPIGTAFAAGNAVLSRCPTDSTFAAEGCLGGDYTYTLTVEASAVTLGNVLFEVKTASGAIYVPTGPGGFSVLSISDSVVAQFPVASLSPMAMVNGFTDFGSGVSPSTSLTSLDTILLDVGTINPMGQGLTFVVLGTDGYSGSTTLALP